MNRRSIGVFLLFGLAILSGLRAEGLWTHFAPTQASSLQALELQFNDPAGEILPLEARLHLSLDGMPLPPLDPASLGAGEILFRVPPELLDGVVLRYFVELVLDSGPGRIPEQGTFNITLAPEAYVEHLTLLSDLEMAEGEQALIAAVPARDDLDLERLKVVIGGRPAEGELEVDPWLVTWTGQLPPGEHRIELRMVDLKGIPLPYQVVVLNVRGKDVIPSDLSFSAWEEFNMERVSDRLEYGTPREWKRYHAAQFRFQGYHGEGREALKYRGRVYLSALDVESDQLQPQSRVEFEVRKSVFMTGLGDRQPSFTETVLSRTRVRGLELAYNGGTTGFALVAGNTREARDPLWSIDAATSDTLTDFTGSFARRLYGLDFRVGRLNSGFESGFSLLKVKDDVDSIDPFQSSVAPVDNIVTGLRLNLRAFKGHLVVRNQAALSLYNSNIAGGAWNKSDLDSLGLDNFPDPASFENLIVINEYFSPLDLADRNFTSSLAMISSWGVAAGPHDLHLDFRSVGPNYVSLGNTYLTPDRRILRLSDRLRLNRNQLYLDGAFSRTVDNLEGQLDGSVGTTTESNLHAGAGWYPRQRDLQLRAGLDWLSEKNQATEEVEQVQADLLQLSVGLSGGVYWLEHQHQYTLNLLLQNKQDDVGRVEDALTMAVLRNDLSFTNLQFSGDLRTPLSARLLLRLGLGWYDFGYKDELLSDNSYWNFHGSLNRNWLKGRLNTTLRTQVQGVTSGEGAAAAKYMRIDLGAEAGWTIRSGMSLASRLMYQGYSGDRDDGYFQVVLRFSQEW